MATKLKEVGTVGDALATIDARSEGLTKLREPFPDKLISKLPKPTKPQTDEVKADYKKGIRCKLCGAWHHPDVVHLDYVGHAALTHRLLDVDPLWSWEPCAFDERGLPAFDGSGGLWIKLTICGITRLGYGHAAAKPNQDPGAREKEAIGDALRNAAMRFGAALDLWFRGDLHADEGNDNNTRPEPKPEPEPENNLVTNDQCFDIMALARNARVTVQTICEAANVSDLRELTDKKAQNIVKRLNATIEKMKATRADPANVDVLDDEIPY